MAKKKKKGLYKINKEAKWEKLLNVLFVIPSLLKDNTRKHFVQHLARIDFGIQGATGIFILIILTIWVIEKWMKCMELPNTTIKENGQNHSLF